jgi:hypothetical protein
VEKPGCGGCRLPMGPSPFLHYGELSVGPGQSRLHALVHHGNPNICFTDLPCMTRARVSSVFNNLFLLSMLRCLPCMTDSWRARVGVVEEYHLQALALPEVTGFAESQCLEEVQRLLKARGNPLYLLPCYRRVHEEDMPYFSRKCDMRNPRPNGSDTDSESDSDSDSESDTRSGSDYDSDYQVRGVQTDEEEDSMRV